MNKKKAIKIATSAVLTASSFAAVATINASAATTTNVDTLIQQAVDQMQKAQDAFAVPAAKQNKAVDAAVVKAEIDKAQALYAQAKAAIAKDGKWTKTRYAKLATTMHNYDLAVGYYNGKLAAEQFNQNVENLASAVQDKNNDDISKYLPQVQDGLTNITATVKQNVIGAAAVRLTLASLNLDDAKTAVDNAAGLQAPVISNIHFSSNNADNTKAMNGDILTLTFTSNQPITKLSNFKINGSNPDTFTHVGNVYTATHKVDSGDHVGPATFQINVKNDAGIYSQTIENTTDGSSVGIVDEYARISNVKVWSSNSDPTKAEVGDTIYLAFTSDEPVTKLGNFKMDGSNPDTFGNVGNMYVVTHKVDAGDADGLATFQINVKNDNGIYSPTVETTTDGSKVVVGGISLQKATDAVVKAEQSKLQADVDAARALVDALPADVAPSTAKADLEARLTAVLVQNATDAVVKAEQSKLQADVDAAKALVDALPADATAKADLEARLDAIEMPVISNVKITSNNANNTKAMVGDTITLTFTSNEPVTKLSNFKIDGSNPDTFTHVGNVYTATHKVDAGDQVGTNATFQINVENAAGIYSQTVENTTDGSSVAIVDEYARISNVKLSSTNADPTKATIGDTIYLTFTSDEPITKLSNFKIDGSNPDTFANIAGNVYVASHKVDAGDVNGPVTFQINVKNDQGIYSPTVETTTDGKAVVISGVNTQQ